ncbi:unnamed protein product [Macrosiphum euphorbiae]|uniref:Uncharacterized protein n=1 Tax=Macrosiphum euphorbiae TaxID=13131 RepID=A0AAV0XWB5_9HEMI|nr:unnamed protein product [Macrosiphum euphorbiae]
MANLNLFRRKQFTPIETVRLYIKNIVNTSNQLHWYKWVHLKCIRQGFTVTQETIRHLLLEVDPEGVVFSRDVLGTRQLLDGRALDIIFKTRLLLGTRRNTTFLLDSYPMANDNLFINIVLVYYL